MIMQPHFKQLQFGFRTISSDILYPTDIFLQCVDRVVTEELGGDYSCVVPLAPDIGAALIVEAYAKRLNSDYAVGDKRRNSDTEEVYIRAIYGDIKGKTVLVFDDIVDTGGTLIKLLAKARELGAVGAYAFITHGVFAGKCLEKLGAAYQDGLFRHLYVTDTIRNDDRSLPPEFITVTSCGKLIGEAIFRNHTDSSISEIDGMFSKRRNIRP